MNNLLIISFLSCDFVCFDLISAYIDPQLEIGFSQFPIYKEFLPVIIEFLQFFYVPIDSIM